jgi:hypothetical protein
MKISLIDLKSEIRNLFLSYEKDILRIFDIELVVRSNRKVLGLPKSITVEEIQEFLVREGIFHKVIFQFPSTTEIRFANPARTIFEVILSLRLSSYFTHYSALYINGLVDRPNNIIYLNWEQQRKSILTSDLSQDGIKNAFSRPQRIPKQGLATVNNLKIFILNGRNTDRLGVISIEHPEWGTIRVTDVERTLIDSTVRPDYVGGVSVVLEAFKQAKMLNKVSETKLINYLKIISYIYPYHQSIGFYMEKSQVFTTDAIESLHSIPMDYDFYLGYHLQDMEYSKRWRLYYPRGL